MVWVNIKQKYSRYLLHDGDGGKLFSQDCFAWLALRVSRCVLNSVGVSSGWDRSVIYVVKFRGQFETDLLLFHKLSFQFTMIIWTLYYDYHISYKYTTYSFPFHIYIFPLSFVDSLKAYQTVCSRCGLLVTDHVSVTHQYIKMQEFNHHCKLAMSMKIRQFQLDL